MFQGSAIFIDTCQYRRRDREYDAGRAEPALRQDVVDEVAVNAPIAIHKGMDIHKSEGEHCSRNHGIETLCCTAIKGDHTFNQRSQVVCARADVVRDGCSRIAVVFADEPSGFPQSESNESRISDDKGLESEQFIHLDRPATRLPYGSAPAQNAVVGWAFTLDARNSISNL